MNTNNPRRRAAWEPSADVWVDDSRATRPKKEDVARPRRRRVSALLAEKGLGDQQRSRKPERPIPAHGIGLDLVTLSEEETERRHPALTLPTVAPKRGPLRQTSRPLQGVSFVEDVVGKTLGKENIPPGMSLKGAKPRNDGLRTTRQPLRERQQRGSPPKALRRHRVEKVRPKPGVSSVSQRLQRQQEKYPVLPEHLDKPELYEDSWLSYQEVSITQLVNRLFDTADVSSRHDDQKDGALRRKLLAVYQDPAIPLLHKRLQASLMYGALSIPKDLLAKALRLKDDVGLRRKYLDLFVNTYEPSVLRAAAEAIVGRECPVQSSQQRAEKKAIEGFLDTFFIRNEDAVRVKTGFGSIASKGGDFGSQAWSWRRTTLRSLMLLLLLDMAKSKDVVSMPLFLGPSPHKSSDAVLQELASMLLPSLGHLSRPLSHLDYHLHCVQHPLHEYKYRIDNLATDLRDGVLLTRLTELLVYRQGDVTVTMPTGEVLTSREKELWVLTRHLKFPCAARAQKLYNVQVALSALERVRGIVGQAVKNITAENIVDGHREQTLGLLWALVGKWGLEALVDWTEMETETQRCRNRYCGQHQDPDSEDESELAQLQGLDRYSALLGAWARGIARLRGLRVANLTTSFSDGRVLEAILDEYTACFPATAALATSLPAKLRSIGCSSAFVSLFTATSAASSRPIPSNDFTVTALTFLASHLLPASRANRAACTLQRWYRIRLARREASKRVALMRLAAHCATVVQTRERLVGAAIVLQRAWREILDARIGRLVHDVTAFQALARGCVVRRAVLARRKGGTARRVERVRGGW